MLPDVSHSQHRPVVIDMGVEIPIVKSTSKLRWKFNNTNWLEHTKEFDGCARFIDPKTNKYHCITELIFSIAKKHVLRCFRKNYFLGWAEESKMGPRWKYTMRLCITETNYPQHHVWLPKPYIQWKPPGLCKVRFKSNWMAVLLRLSYKVLYLVCPKA